MEIKIITGANQVEAIKNTLHDLPRGEEVFIVVPDRQTLQIEEMLFDELNLASTFDINVVGLTNLATKYVGVELQPLSEIESLLYVKKAVENVKQNLCYFKSTNITFCKEVFKFISQLAASGIAPQDICSRQNSPLQKKVADIKLIYQEYQMLTSEKTDPNQLLQKFEQTIESQNLFANSSFYFVGFDSFTLRHYELISALAKKCKRLCVSLPAPLTRKNAYIYDGDIMQKMQNLAKSLHQTIQVYSPPTSLHGEAKEIASQLFSGDKMVADGKNVRIFGARSARQEADWVAKIIAFEVFNGRRYKDFSVAVSDIQKYGDELAEAFEKNGIPYYLDTSISANKTYLALVFKKLITFAYKNFTKHDLLFLLNCPLFEQDREQISYVSKAYQGGAKQFFALKGLPQIKKIVEAAREDVLQGASLALEFLRENVEKCAALIQDEKTLDMERQIPDILSSIIEASKQIGSTSSMKEFIAAVELGLEATQVSAIPSYVDQVYVGDATDSFFGESEILFVVGANAGAMPKITMDNSIFADEELQRAGFIRSVEPTVKTINRRARFKVFSLLSSWKKRLYITYALSGEDDKPISPSMIVGELAALFNKEGKIITNIMPDNLEDINQLLLAIGKNKIGAEQVMAEASSPQIKQLLNEVLQVDLAKFDRIKPLACAKTLKLGEAIKPTEIEKFYDCPFKVYCENVLKLKEKQLQALSPAEIGSIVHDVLENYGKQFNYAVLDAAEMQKFIDKQLENDYDFGALPDGELVLRRLKKDLFKICASVAQENASSPYQPWLIEQKIEGKVQGKPFYGRVDRVDKTGDVFRVIDYKTGRITTNLIRELSYGKKLQLFSYAKMISQKYGLKCGGVYYFDVKAGYTNSAKTLVGLTSEFGADADGQKTVSQQQMTENMQQAENLLASGAKFLSEGKLLPRPDAHSCEYCKYKAICLYDQENGVRRMKGGEA